MGALTLEELLSASREGRSVCHWSMIADFDPATTVFTRSDGAVSAFLAVEPFAALDLADGTLTQCAETLAHAIGALQVNEMLSIHVLRSRRVDAAIEAYRRFGDRPLPILQRWRQTRAEFVARGAHEPLLRSHGMPGDLHTRTLRIIIGITVPPLQPFGVREGLLAALQLRAADGAATRRVQAARSQLIERLLSRIALIAARMQVVGCRCTAVDEREYLALVREMLFPRSRAPIGEDDGHLPLYRRLPIADVVADPAQGCLWSDGACLQAATVRGHPRLVHPGMLSLPHTALGGATLLDALEAGWLSITARALGVEGTRFVLQNLSTNIRGGFVLPGRAQDLHADAALAQRWLEAEGRRFFEVETVAVAWADDHQAAEARLRRVRDQLSEVVARTDIERHAAPAFILRALPGNAFPPVAGLDRSVTLVDRQIADLMPVYYRSRGTAEALMLLHGQTGEPFPFSLWGGSSQGTLVAGQPGQGKSVLVQCLALDLLCREHSQVIVLDIGRSYLPACLLFQDQGQYLDCATGRCCINPLAGTHSANGLAALRLLEAACSRPGSAALTPAQIGLLSTAVADLYGQHQSSTTYQRRDELGDPAYIVHATKRLVTSFVSDAQRARLDAAGQGASVSVLYRYRVQVVVVRAPDGAASDEVLIACGHDLPAASVAALNSLGIRWSDDADGCELQASSAALSEVLRSYGISVVLDERTCLADVAEEADVIALERVGVTVHQPAEVSARCAREVAERLAGDPANAGMPAVRLAAAIDRAQRALGGIEAYRATTGTAVLQREVLLGDLGRLLEERCRQEPTDAAIDLVQRLQPFYGGRAYARFFDGPTSIRLAGSLFVDLELGTLIESLEPHLVTCVVSALLHHLACYCIQPAQRHLRKLVVIEEAAQLLRADTGIGGRSVVGDRIDALYRTGRKHGVAVVVVTQGVTDLIDHPSGAAILEQCVIKLILKQSETAIARIATALRLTPEQTAMLGGLGSIPGHASQVLVISSEHAPRIFDVAMVILHPFQYWMTTTRPEDVCEREEAVDAYRQQHLSDQEARLRATRDCAERYPHGMPRR
jgi:hypothetical protein